MRESSRIVQNVFLVARITVGTIQSRSLQLSPPQGFRSFKVNLGIRFGTGTASNHSCMSVGLTRQTMRGILIRKKL